MTISHWIAPFLLLLWAGCGSSRMTAPDPQSDRHGGYVVSEKATDPAVSSARKQLEAVLRAEIADWQGVRHVMGGNGKSGTDCSGLVQRIFADALNVWTPRTTAQLKKFGTRVRRSSLAAGDLVFFRPEGKERHVGIFLDEDQFAHVSSSRGVMISRLSESYWSRYYTGGRRVLNSAEAIRNAVSYSYQALERKEMMQNRSSGGW